MARGRYDIPLDEEKRIYLAGVKEFNEGQFFEAHEIWEDAWNGTSGRRSDFYRGLIQMAVALEHYRRLNGLGVRKVFASAKKLWATLPEVYMGLDLRDFEGRMEEALVDVLAAKDGQAIHLDVAGFFAIEWLYDPFDAPREEAED